MATRTSTALLEGVTVLDLTQFLAGPYGGQILGDLGARVIKIEPPEGEMTRRLPPHEFKGESAYFLSINRNKESIALDLKTPKGRELLLELVKRSDIVLESFRPGVVDRLGVGYEQLRTANPRIIMCSISGFGQDGPYRDRPAYDIIVQALSGGMSLTGSDGGEPVRSGLPIGDLCAGMYAVIGALAALQRRCLTGEGGYIDVSMLDCQVSMLSYQAAYHLISGEVPGTQGKGHRSIPTYRAFRCADGVEIVVAANTEKMWRSLCEAVGEARLISDARFLSNADRLRNRSALDACLEAAFTVLPSDQVLASLIRLGVPAGPINSLDRVMTDPQVRARNMVIEIADQAGDCVRMVGNPVKVAGLNSAEHRFPPRLGQDTRAVLGELLGLSAVELDALASEGVIADSGATRP